MSKKILQVNDDIFSMFTILVDSEEVEALSKLIKKLHDEFYEDEDEEIQDEWGNYYDYIMHELCKFDDIELLDAPAILEL